jgi:hypothetical protein
LPVAMEEKACWLLVAGFLCSDPVIKSWNCENGFGTELASVYPKIAAPPVKQPFLILLFHHSHAFDEIRSSLS